MKTIKQAIQAADLETLDGLWAILKYRDIGILRKLKSMSRLLDIDSNEVFCEAEKDEDGRVLDKQTRKAIHDILLEASKNSIQLK
jgi:hypothetical protein